MVDFDSEKSRKLSGCGNLVSFPAKSEDDGLFSIVFQTGNDVRRDAGSDVRRDAGSDDATQSIFFRHKNVTFVVARVGESNSLQSKKLK